MQYLRLLKILEPGKWPMINSDRKVRFKIVIYFFNINLCILIGG